LDWIKEGADIADGLPELVDGSDGFGALVRLELSEGHLDGVVVLKPKLI
jgi:hypothetical protein